VSREELELVPNASPLARGHIYILWINIHVLSQTHNIIKEEFRYDAKELNYAYKTYLAGADRNS
jgi:hypothetical protein